jgi:hypothetical protein
MTEYVKHNLVANSSKHIDLLLRDVGDIGDNSIFSPEALKFDLIIYAFFTERCEAGTPFLHMNATKRKLSKTYGPNGINKAGALNNLGRAFIWYACYFVRRFMRSKAGGAAHMC